MSKVSVGYGYETLLSGVISVRVEDDEGARVYKIKSTDLDAIYESIRREVLEDIHRGDGGASTSGEVGELEWHLEHSDGTRWTSRELDEIARRNARDGENARWLRADRLLIDQYGDLWIRDTRGRLWSLDGGDMEVARGL